MVFFSGNNHFTIFVEVVNAYKVQTVCIFFRNCLISALLQLAAVAYIIVGIVNFNKTDILLNLSVYFVYKAIVCFIPYNTCSVVFFRNDHLAIFAKVISAGRQ